MSGYLGVIDWGIGGLGVYQALRKTSHTPTIYFSDSGHLPYGKTKPGKLEKRLDEICEFLRSKGAEKIAIACNAASASYEDREDVSGIISHGVNAIRNGHWSDIGLIAGRGTVNSNIYQHQFDSFGIKLKQRIAQPLSAHIEAGRLSNEELDQDLHEILSPISNRQAILLACTHYPVIKNQIRRHVDQSCELVDPAGEMADWILGNWQFDQCEAQDEWYTTGDASQFKIHGNLAFGVDVGSVTRLQSNFKTVHQF